MRYLSVFLWLATVTMAELIPADRLYTDGWESAGVSGGVPAQTQTIYTTLTTTGDATDRTTAINNAIAACPEGQVVKLGAGTFRIDGVISLTNETGVILRGSGPGVTILDSRTASTQAMIVGNGSFDWNGFSGTTLSANEAQGQTVISMTSTASFSIGDRVQFMQDNSATAAWPVIGDFGDTGRGMRHQSKITDKDGSTITIADPLPYEFTTAADAQVRAIQDGFAYQCGIEDLTLDMSNGGSQVYGVLLWNADQCWLYNVELVEADNYLVYLLKALHCTVKKSYMNTISGSGSNGAGLIIEQSSMCLVEDNIIRGCFPNVEINFGCTGNVFAYNALLQSDGEIYFDSNHGAHNAFNLFEGNVAPNIKPDGYFGSVSHDTIIRNRFTGADDIDDSHTFAVIDLKRFTRYYNIVGNVLGTSLSADYEQTASAASGAAIYQLGYPSIGNTVYSGTAEPSTGDWWTSWPTDTLPNGYGERDLDVANTLIRKGNYNTADSDVPASESLGEDTVPDSYYLDSKPDWFYGLTWPPVDPTNPVIDHTDSYELIPAGYRYLNGGEDPPSDTFTPLSGRSHYMIH